MFKVTDAATAFVADELDRLETPARVVRFCLATDGLHMRLSNAQSGDTQFVHQGRTVFVVDDDLAERLAGRTLDVKETADGVKLSLGEPRPGTVDA
jgi:hypothetical protein